MEAERLNAISNKLADLKAGSSTLQVLHDDSKAEAIESASKVPRPGHLETYQPPAP